MHGFCIYNYKKQNIMYKLYQFFRRHRIWFWGLVMAIIMAVGGLASRCGFEENIFKLLPDAASEQSEEFRVTFTNLKLKDKIFVQTVPVTPDDTTDYEVPSQAELAEAMDFFMDSLLQKTKERNSILYILSDIDPIMLSDVAEYAMEHMPAYLDLDSVLLDSLCSEEHIRYQIQQYDELFETDYGDFLMDIAGYDPCGIGLGVFSAVLPEGTIEQLMEGSDRPSRLYNNHLYAPDAQACLGFITPNFGTDDSREASRLVASMKEVRDAVREAYPNVDVLFHGAIVIAGGNSKQMRKDIYITVGIAMLIVFILLALCLKRPSYLLITIIALAFGILLAMACIYVIQSGFSMMSLGIGCIVLGVAFSYVLHVLIHYLYTGSLEMTLKEQTKPVLVGSLTTIGAFAGLLLTQSPLLKDFGLFALFVIIGTTFISLLVAPHMLPRKFAPNKRAFTFLEKVNSYHLDRNKPVVIITIILVAVCICFSGRYSFDSDLRHISYIHPECTYAQNHWNELMNNGYNQQYYAAFGKDLESALEKLPNIEKTVDSLRNEGLVAKGLNRSMLWPDSITQQRRIEAWHAYFTPAKQKEVWQYIEDACDEVGYGDASLYEPFMELMAQTHAPERILEADILPPEVLENFVETKDSLTLVYFSVNATKENTLAVNDCLTQQDGCMLMNPYYYCKNLIDLIHEDFNLIMIISAAFVFLLLLVTYRNIWIALIALMPMVLSWYTVLGAMALTGHTFNLVNIIVSSFVFGIGVDYSVFIMEGLLKGNDDNPTMVYNKTAITMSAVILIICMFVLGFAIHPAVKSISFASLVGMITTITLSYTLEPILYRFYMWVRAKRKSKKIIKR